MSATFGITDGSKDVEIGEEAGKTVFGFWLNTKPQETQDATIVYQIPGEVDLSLLTIQRQPGANPDEVQVLVEFQGKINRDTALAL
jgi:hypothetical protein